MGASVQATRAVLPWSIILSDSGCLAIIWGVTFRVRTVTTQQDVCHDPHSHIFYALTEELDTIALVSCYRSLCLDSRRDRSGHMGFKRIVAILLNHM